jgi:glycosyltransferase involved in cell wall biosynthesis
MRIVGIFDRLAAALTDRRYVLGGAERTALTHFSRLADERGRRCHVLTPATVRLRGRIGALPVWSYRDLEELKACLTKLRPAAVFSNLDLVYDAANLTRSMGIPHIALLNSFECCEPDDEEKRRWGVSLDRRYLPADRVAFALRSSARVVACSDALSRRVRRRHAVRVETLYPSFDEQALLRRPATAGRGSFITGICGYEYKGAGIFLELCRRFPDERFLLAGSVHPQLQPRCATEPNLTLATALDTRDLLARSRLVLVPSQWEEPFGRIAVEAMANDIPVLASWTGGLREIVGRTALAVRRFRDPDAWDAALRVLLSSPAVRAANASAGRRRARRFLAASAAVPLDRIVRTVARTSRAPTRRSHRVAIVGSRSAKTAFSLINARLGAELEQSGSYSVAHCGDTDPTGIGAVDCFIHHDYAVEFATVPPPRQGMWVAIRPWDFGSYPPAWAGRIRSDCDQLWVPSRWSKRLAVRGGIPASRVAVIPFGIDPATFTPAGPRRRIGAHKRFRFLFVGAPIYRKGLDILLDAYSTAFTCHDDVCLVIKSHRDDLFYAGVDMRARIDALRSQPGHPEVVVIDEFLADAELAALYRACDVGVFPYRAEGFALPILEAMACGVPSIVPEFGACLDYCTAAASFRVPVRRVHLPLLGAFQFNTLGFRETIDEVDFGEMPVSALADEMQRVAGLSAASIQPKADAGVRVSHGSFTWAHTRARMLHELERLGRRRIPLRLAAERRARAIAQRQRSLAVALLARAERKGRSAPASGAPAV